MKNGFLAGSSLAEFPGGLEGSEGTVGLGHFAGLTSVPFIPIKKKSIGGFVCSSQREKLRYMWHLLSLLL